jgi:UDP-N-acetylglucosamine--N-acetylmuramyl-(pentapeptide) pyrophosphoryl-undecaprenol N-acetylglucosamine transferase
VASTGGHLAQSVKWAKRLKFDESSLFVTFDTEQSRSLLSDKQHHFVPYVAPRDWVTTAKVAGMLLQRAFREPFDAVFSSGSAVALSALPVSWVKRLPYFYVESVSRFAGPSLSGRVLERVPGMKLFAQHPGYKSPRWKMGDCLLEDYKVADELRSSDEDALRVFVTLGTIKPYAFDRMVDSVLPALRPQDDVVWQLGETLRTGLPGETRAHIPADRFATLLKESDVIVTHAGVGTLMGVLDAGKVPLVMARKAELGEHVDDHQAQVTRRLVELGLAKEIRDTTSRGDLLSASGLVVVSESEPLT